MMYMSVFPSPTRSPSRSVMSSGGMEEPTFQVMRCTLQTDHMGATALTRTAERCYCSYSHNKGISEVGSLPRIRGAQPRANPPRDPFKIVVHSGQNFMCMS